MLAQEQAQAVAAEAHKGFDAGETIIEHVSNSGLDHPLFHLPRVLGIDFSVTKHVLMLWLVAAFVFVVVTWTVRRYLGQDRRIPSGFMNAFESVVEFVRDSIVLPNVGKKWVNTWTPLLLTFFIFILCANAIGLIPVFDTLAVLDHFVFRTGEGAKLAAASRGFVVGFQADEIDVERRSGWSVLAVGEAYEILDPARLSELADRLPAPWAPDRTGHCISIPLQRLTGRWLSPAG